jgi:hypothetical protein
LMAVYTIYCDGFRVSSLDCVRLLSCAVHVKIACNIYMSSRG